MLNTNSLGKYLLVILVLLIGCLYALPNMYGEDHAVQIKAKRDAQVTQMLMDTALDTLRTENIAVKSANLEDQQILIRLLDGDTQSRANDLIAAAIGSDYISAPNLATAAPQWLAALGGQPMKLGLDLRGGVHFLMEVDMKTAINTALEQNVSGFRSDLQSEKIRHGRIARIDGTNDIKIAFRSEEHFTNGLEFLEDRYPSNEMVFTDITQGNSFALRAKLTEAQIKEIKNKALTQNISVIRNRVNEIGVAEPLVARQGAERIVVQLPGIQDTATAKKILGETSTLRFHMVDNRSPFGKRAPTGTIKVKQRIGGHILLKKRVMLSGQQIIDAQASLDENGAPQVNITLNSKGGDKMLAATKNAIGKRMAVVLVESRNTGKKDLDGKPIYENYEEVITSPTVQARLGRQFRITGLSPQESRDLSLTLRAGAMIAPAHIVEERTIGPSLGKENIARGMDAVMYGFIAVLIFMIIYYRGFGLVANFALAANLVLIMGIMSLFPGATLTLPGIAGIVLTVGMAVDANVLIFERIREELRQGRSVQQAIHHGYDSAFSTIFDANITTLIAAVVLFGIGTGPIKGFAITLSIGILTSMFTAIVVTRLIVNGVWGGRKLEKLPI